MELIFDRCNLHTEIFTVKSYHKLRTVLFSLSIGNEKKNYRSSHRRCPIKKVFLKTSQNSKENTCARSLLYSCFPANFEKFLRTPFQQNIYWRLLLELLRNHTKKSQITIIVFLYVIVYQNCYCSSVQVVAD